MDGTPYVTQCPILPEARCGIKSFCEGPNLGLPSLRLKLHINVFRFVYKFRARTTGTMFYHSHTSFQRGDGAFGPYIVRRTPESEPNSHLYDFDLTEHLIFPQEWFHSVSFAMNIRKITYFNLFIILGLARSFCFTSLVRVNWKSF